jgi:hypothetical protein
MKRAALRALALMLAAVSAACGGGTSPLTQIVVVVDSDLSVPSQLDAIRIEVSGGQGAAQTTDASLANQSDLPRSLGLVHSTGELGPVRVRVLGLSSDVSVVERSAVVSFTQDKTVVLRVTLARSCANSVGLACGPSKTCDAGRCVDPAVSPLSVWDGKVTPPAAGHSAAGGGAGGSAGTDAGRAGAAGSAGGAGKGSAGKPAPGGAGKPAAGSGGSAGNAGAGAVGAGTNQVPVCTISKPTAGTSFVQSDSIAFMGSCTDTDTGAALSMGLSWDSDGTMIGAGTHPMISNLSVGSHKIKLCAANPDDASLVGCADITITVISLSATIGSLTQGSTTGGTFTTGSAIVATGSGTGADPVTLTWNDSLIGTVAGSNTATLSDPLVGRHRLTLTMTDGKMRTATDSRTFVVLASGQSQLIAPYGVVNQALTAAGSGKVDALAADAMNYYVAADQPALLYSFPAGDPTSTPVPGPSPSVKVTALGVMRDVHLHAASGHAYLATNSGLQVCSYTVASGIDGAACTPYQGSMLPSDSIASVLRLNVSGSDRLLVGTGNGLFVPSDVDMPNGSGSKALSVSVVSLAANATTLWTAGVDTVQSADLSTISTNPSWQNASFGGGPYTFTHIALGNSDSVYLSGAAGLGRYTPSTHTWRFWRASSSSSAAPTLSSDDVRSFAIARETIANSARDVVWLGTAAGVSRLDSQLESFTTFTADDGLPSNSVRAVIVLPNGNKLFGTDSGIALYKGQ